MIKEIKYYSETHPVGVIKYNDLEYMYTMSTFNEVKDDTIQNIIDNYTKIHSTNPTPQFLAVIKMVFDEKTYEMDVCPYCGFVLSEEYKKRELEKYRDLSKKRFAFLVRDIL